MSGNGGPYAVDEPIANDVRTVNFFNGRLLAAEDLRREQDANLRLRDRLGLAVGDGVVRGLEVSVPSGGNPADPVVAVSAGVAVNRRGRALELQRDTRVTLARRADPGTAVRTSMPCDNGDFASCSGLGPGAPLTVSGVYLLTIAPAWSAVGRARVSGLGNETAACNTDASADGVEFRAINLNLDPALLADVQHLRNRLAHLLFGTADPRRNRLELDPFGSSAAGYGLLDDLRRTELRDSEVPLGCVFWTPGPGIRFIDLWSARRRVTHRSPSAWPEATGDRRPAEGEAVFLQFQDHLDQLRGQVAPETTVATDHFRYLPPAGLLPLASGGKRGYDFRTFFGTQPVRGPAVLEAVHVSELFRQSYAFPPIELARAETIWLYEVRDNLLPPTTPTAAAPQAYLIFTSGHIPYRADARYELAYWNYANYARVG